MGDGSISELSECKRDHSRGMRQLQKIATCAMTIHVRVADSAEEWQQALAVLYRVYVGEGYTTAERAAPSQRREVLEPEGTFLVAINESGSVIGATLFLLEDSVMKQLARPGEREFRMLAVDPAARGSGAGAVLVQTCIDRAKEEGASGLVLWTQPTMLAAHRLYERLGFMRTPERDEDDPRGFKRLVYLRSFG
jgi:ribosomal protein S18 acetylase RimI-like enzyme